MLRGGFWRWGRTVPGGRTVVMINVICSSIWIKATFPATRERADFVAVNRTRVICTIERRHHESKSIGSARSRSEW